MNGCNRFWRKATFSSDDGACVEVGATLDVMRDSKNPAGGTLTAHVSTLIAAVKAGQFENTL